MYTEVSGGICSYTYICVFEYLLLFLSVCVCIHVKKMYIYIYIGIEIHVRMFFCTHIFQKGSPGISYRSGAACCPCSASSPCGRTDFCLAQKPGNPKVPGYHVSHGHDSETGRWWKIIEDALGAGIKKGERDSKPPQSIAHL